MTPKTGSRPDHDGTWWVTRPHAPTRHREIFDRVVHARACTSGGTRTRPRARMTSARPALPGPLDRIERPVVETSRPATGRVSTGKIDPDRIEDFRPKKRRKRVIGSAARPCGPATHWSRPRACCSRPVAPIPRRVVRRRSPRAAAEACSLPEVHLRAEDYRPQEVSLPRAAG